MLLRGSAQMSMGMLKRKRASPPLEEAPASKKAGREESPPPVGANGQALEVYPGREETMVKEPRVVKQQIGQPHASVLAVLQAERTVESSEDREAELLATMPVLENISHGQLVPPDLPGGTRPGQTGDAFSIPCVPSKVPDAGDAQKPAEKVHLIPCHAGWFQWNSINVLERRGLPEFFSGKSKLKTPEVYLEHKNAIVCKYRENPEEILTIDDVKDILIGDGNAAARIIEFLDHWGIINYQAGPDPKTQLPDWIGQAALIEEAPDRKLEATPLAEPPVQSLYTFDTMRAPQGKSSPAPDCKDSSTSLLDAKVAEALSFSDGLAVEYHCNACAADCSKHRYHCQKQADFDLCPDCYNDGKFGEGMTSTDFIRMDAFTDTADSDGGGWTDQETLLLLEALELFGDNWTEIAEHVATKSKSQCILHFIRLPIEDPFLEDMETAGSVTSAPPPPKASDAKATNDRDASAEAAATPPSASAGVPLSKNSSVVTDSGARSKETGVWRTSRPDSKPEEVIPFADAGNPVMAQVAFLAAMVGPRVAAAAAQSALMSLSGKNPAANIAGKNCFVLDPPAFDWSSRGPDPSRPADPKAVSTSEAGNVDRSSAGVETPSQSVADKEIQAENAKREAKEEAKDGGVEGEEGEGEGEEEEEEEEEEEVEEKGHTMNKEDEEMKKKLELQEAAEGDAGKVESEQADAEADLVDGLEEEEMISVVRVKRAAASALAAAAVKSKLLGDQEERDIQHLVGVVIENQLRKLEIKLKHFNELEVMLAKECEQVDRTRQKYIAERQRLISSRLTQSQSTSMANLFPVTKPNVCVGGMVQSTPVPGPVGMPRPPQVFPFKPANIPQYGARPGGVQINNLQHPGIK